MKGLSIEQVDGAYYDSLPKYYETSDYMCYVDQIYQVEPEYEHYKELLGILKNYEVKDDDISRIKKLIGFVVGDAVNDAVSDFDINMKTELEHQQNLNWIEENS